MKFIESKKVKLKTKRIFMKKGTCSRTFFYILNREFGNPREKEEQAIDPMAGGILQQGYQCGMLWGASMAVGTELYRKYGDVDQAVGQTIRTTQHLMRSFLKRTETVDCYEITNCDFSSKWSMVKHFISGKFYSCFRLAGKWAPEAINVAREELAMEKENYDGKVVSCASEVVRKMGGTDEEIVMVSGFAGGLGLSGNGCGALSAAIWMTVLKILKKENWKYDTSDPITEKILNKFYEETDYEMECSKICGERFETIKDHSEFIKKGGCKKLINVLTGKD